MAAAAHFAAWLAGGDGQQVGRAIERSAPDAEEGGPTFSQRTAERRAAREQWKAAHGSTHDTAMKWTMRIWNMDVDGRSKE